MSNPEMATAPGGGNNASEFVRKLFRMLEDPSHQDVARWGKDGDTFVVVEGEKFTRSILPKHFKHSNMSSFIRQLNKYDFHKVKPSSDSENSSPLGNVLEFKHPYFKIDSKDDLDNIRRKAPAPRKQQVNEDFTTNHHISVMSEQLAATQQQVQQLQELFTEVSQTNKILVNEVLTLTKIINAQKAAQHEMLNYLTPYNNDNQRTPIISQTINSNGRASDADDASVPELRRARELLSSVSTDSVTDRELERLQQHVYGSPTDSSAMITPTSLPLMNDPMHDITRYPVYPVGQTVGIDPFHSDHIHKIPYAMPSDVNASVLGDQPQAPTMAPAPTQTEKPDAMWGPRKPSVFLVEDDPICAKIGIKFLKSMGCEVEHAVSDTRLPGEWKRPYGIPNGADAYTRINSLSRQFDMIFMDIIMPRLDGVSATMYIRQSHPAIPIIAMTSNIRPEEVNGYFEHGMNGVLAKPFTKEGMWKSVRTHLSHLMKNPPQESEIGSGAGYFMGSGTAGSNWSPGQIQQSSMGSGLEQNFGLLNGSGQYAMATGHRPQGFSANLHSADSSSGRLSDVESPPEKRQRLNPQSTYSC